MKKFELLLKKAMDSKSNNIYRINENVKELDNYYLNDMIKFLRYEVLKETSFISLVSGYFKDIKRQTPQYLGYYNINVNPIICNNYSFINILDNKQTSQLIKKYKKLNFPGIEKTIKECFDTFNKMDSLKIDFSGWKINIFDVMNEDFIIFPNSKYSINTKLLFDICRVHNEMEVTIVFENNMFYVTNGKLLFGLITPKKV